MPTVLRPDRLSSAPAEEDDHDRRMTANLAVMIVCLVLLGAGLYLVESLHRAARVESCLEAGRTACPIKGPPPPALPGSR
jgi:hypothetical protein